MTDPTETTEDLSDIVTTEIGEDGKQKIIIDIDRLKSELKTEVVLLRDEKEGLAVELHSTKIDIEQLTNLSTSTFNFLKESRKNPGNNQKPLGVG